MTTKNKSHKINIYNSDSILFEDDPDDEIPYQSGIEVIYKVDDIKKRSEMSLVEDSSKEGDNLNNRIMYLINEKYINRFRLNFPLINNFDNKCYIFLSELYEKKKIFFILLFDEIIKILVNFKIKKYDDDNNYHIIYGNLIELSKDIADSKTTLDDLVTKIASIINILVSVSDSVSVSYSDLKNFLFSVMLELDELNKLNKKIPKEYKETILKNINKYLKKVYILPPKEISKQIYEIDNFDNLKSEIKNTFSISDTDMTLNGIENEITNELLENDLSLSLATSDINWYALWYNSKELKNTNRLSDKSYILLNLYIMIQYKHNPNNRTSTINFNNIKRIDILKTDLYNRIHENLETLLKNKNMQVELKNLYNEHSARYHDFKYYLDGCDVIHDVVHKSLYFNKLTGLKKNNNNLDISNLFYNKVRCDQHEIGKKRHDATISFVKFLNEKGLSFSIPEEIQLSKVNGEDYIMFYFEILKMKELFPEIEMDKIKYIYRESGSNLTYEKLLTYYTSLDSKNKQNFKDECINKFHDKNLSEQLFNLLFDNNSLISYDFNVNLNTLSLFDACKKSVDNIDELEENYSIFNNVYGYYDYHVFSKIYNGKNHHIVAVFESGQPITEDNILAGFCINGDVPINFLLNENNKLCIINGSDDASCKITLERTGDAKNTYFINMSLDILLDLKGHTHTLFKKVITKCPDGYYFNSRLLNNEKQLLLFGNKTIGDLIFSKYNNIYCLTTVDSLVADSVLYDFLCGNNNKLPSVWRYRKGWTYREGQISESPKSLTLSFFTQLACVIAFLKYYVVILNEFGIEFNNEKKIKLEEFHDVLINLFFGEMSNDELYKNHILFNRINNMLRFILTFKFQSNSINLNYNLTYDSTQAICENFYYMVFLNEINHKFNLINNYVDNLIDIYNIFEDTYSTNRRSKSNSRSNSKNKTKTNSNRKSLNKIKNKLIKSNNNSIEKYNYFINKFKILPRLNILLYINSIPSYNNNIYDSIVDEFTLKNSNNNDKHLSVSIRSGKTTRYIINIDIDKKIIHKVRKIHNDGKKEFVKIYKIIELHAKNIGNEIQERDYILYLNNNEIINNYNYGTSNSITKYFYEDSSGNKIGKNDLYITDENNFIKIDEYFESNFIKRDDSINNSNTTMIFIDKSLNDDLLQILIYTNSIYSPDSIKETLGNEGKLIFLGKYGHTKERITTFIYLLEYPNIIGNLFNLLSHEFTLKHVKTTYYILVKIIKYFMDELIKYIKIDDSRDADDSNDIVKNMIIKEIIKNKLINNIILYILNSYIKNDDISSNFPNLELYMSSISENSILEVSTNNMMYIDETRQEDLYDEYIKFIKYFFMKDNHYNNKYFVEDEENDDEFKYVESYESEINVLIARKKQEKKEAIQLKKQLTKKPKTKPITPPTRKKTKTKPITPPTRKKRKRSNSNSNNSNKSKSSPTPTKTTKTRRKKHNRSDSNSNSLPSKRNRY